MASSFTASGKKKKKVKIQKFAKDNLCNHTQIWRQEESDATSVSTDLIKPGGQMNSDYSSEGIKKNRINSITTVQIWSTSLKMGNAIFPKSKDSNVI